MKYISARLTLILLVLGAVIPVAVVDIFIIIDAYQREEMYIAQGTINRARAIVSALEREFSRTQTALLTLATSTFLAKNDLAGFHTRALDVLPTLGAENIVLLDTTGQIVLTTAREFGVPLPKVPKPVLLQRILKTGQPGVSDLFVGPVAGHLIYTVAVPVRRDGEIVYSLNATGSHTQMQTLLAEQKLPASWRGLIVDNSGQVVARTPDIENYLGKPVLPELWQKITTTHEASFKSSSLETIPIVQSFSRSQATGWSVALGAPQDELLAELRRTLLQSLIKSAAALIIGLLCAWFVGGRIAHGITSLLRPAKDLGAGKAVDIPHTRFKEIHELGGAILAAAKALNQSNHDALHDALTGLPNRVLFKNVVEQQLKLCLRNNAETTILYIDLDGFKTVNDTRGHAFGDQLLQEVAVRIKHAIRSSDIAARLGGDEFAVALVNTGLHDAGIIVEKLIGIISQPYALGDTAAAISASIGVAAFPETADDCDTLFKHADQAMYAAKARGKRCYCVAASALARVAGSES